MQFVQWLSGLGIDFNESIKPNSQKNNKTKTARVSKKIQIAKAVVGA
jgi:hypothetical protein